MRYSKFHELYALGKMIGIDGKTKISNAIPFLNSVIELADMVFCMTISEDEAISKLKKYGIKFSEAGFKTYCVQINQDYEIYCMEHTLFN